MLENDTQDSRARYCHWLNSLTCKSERPADLEGRAAVPRIVKPRGIRFRSEVQIQSNAIQYNTIHSKNLRVPSRFQREKKNPQNPKTTIWNKPKKLNLTLSTWILENLNPAIPSQPGSRGCGNGRREQLPHTCRGRLTRRASERAKALLCRRDDRLHAPSDQTSPETSSNTRN